MAQELISLHFRRNMDLNVNFNKSERCAQLFKKLQIFGYENINKDGIQDRSLLPGVNMKIEDNTKVVDSRQFLMKHILDCISALRYIQSDFNEIAKQFPAHTVDVLAAKDCVFHQAVSLSMKGIFDLKDRDERVDLLLNAFPGEDESFLPLHWAMLAGADVDDKTVEIIYNENSLALRQYHQLPNEKKTII